VICIFTEADYLAAILKSAFEPCIPTGGTPVPDWPEWLHEIKHDGYRLIVQRHGKRVRLFTRNGHDWSDRFPLITEAALRNRNSSSVIDGEAVLLGIDGRSDFNGLHSRKHDDEVMFYAFDILVSDGEDLRRLPLSMRKANLARLLARHRWHLPVRLRAGRDRPGPVPTCLPDGAGGPGLETPRKQLSRRPVPALGQGQEPGASGFQPGVGPILAGTIASVRRRFNGGALPNPRTPCCRSALASATARLKMPGPLFFDGCRITKLVRSVMAVRHWWSRARWQHSAYSLCWSLTMVHGISQR
jgi:ATP dependent DNA ligase domain